MSNLGLTANTGNEIEIQVNGAARRVPAQATVLALIEDLGLIPARVAVERNRLIVKRPHWGTTVIQPGDQIEIVQFVGGG